MPETRQRIEEMMKMELNPLVYLEYTPVKRLSNLVNRKRNFGKSICMGYVSKPYEHTYRITTCRHLIINANNRIPSKSTILKNLEVFIRFKGVNKKFVDLMMEDVDIKVHKDDLVDLLFIEITKPEFYNFQLLNQASVKCRRRFPGRQVFYFQNNDQFRYFRLFEGRLLTEKMSISEITREGYFYLTASEDRTHFREYDAIHTTKDEIIKGASGSPILSRRAEVVGIICAHEQRRGKGIYLSIERIENFYNEISTYHL